MEIDILQLIAELDSFGSRNSSATIERGELLCLIDRVQGVPDSCQDALGLGEHILPELNINTDQ